MSNKARISNGKFATSNALLFKKIRLQSSFGFTDLLSPLKTMQRDLAINRDEQVVKSVEQLAQPRNYRTYADGTIQAQVQSIQKKKSEENMSELTFEQSLQIEQLFQRAWRCAVRRSLMPFKRNGFI